MRTFSSLVVLLATIAQAQVRPPPAVDAGVARADAGVVVEAPKPPPPVPSVNDAELARLHREIGELKGLLERHASQTEAMSSAIDKLGKQVASLRTEFNDAEQRRTEEQRVAAERKAATSQASAGLAWAQQQLSTGSTNVNDALRAAELTYTGSALRAVQSARAALVNSDLNAARTWLAIAIYEAANPHD